MPVIASLAALTLVSCAPPRPNDYAVADWLTNPNDAVAAAMQKGRPMFVVFLSTDWSVASQGAVKDVLDTRAFKEFADDNLVLLKVDFNRKGLAPEMAKNYAELAKALNVDHFPVFMMLDPYHGAGKFTQISTYGFGGPGEFVTQVSGILDTWRQIVATKTTQAQAQVRAQAAAPPPAIPRTLDSSLPPPEVLFGHGSAQPISAPSSSMPGLSSTLPSQSAPSATPTHFPPAPNLTNQLPPDTTSAPAGSTDSHPIQLK